MSGHSKWANIQHRKFNQDIKKSKKFSKILKEISVIVKVSGINSFRFKNIISNAKSLNIPKKTIYNSIKKILQIKKNDYKYINLEGKIDGVIIIMECYTDNNIRTISSIKSFFNKNGGKLCNNGELIHFFYRRGVFYIKNKYINKSLEEFELMTIDFGAENFLKTENKIIIYTNFENFGLMKAQLEKLKIFNKNKLYRVPKKFIKYITNNKKEKIITLIKKLEKHEDINNIYSNLDI